MFSIYSQSISWLRYVQSNFNAYLLKMDDINKLYYVNFQFRKPLKVDIFRDLFLW